ncbi:transposase [Chitinimonas koreensis]|nr:transposase [Chitinimonas koreensis]
MQRRAKPHRPLSETQARRNRRIARIRARGEHPFAGLRQLGGKVLQRIGLKRAALQLQLKAATYNLKRLSGLKEAGVMAF